MAASIFSWKFRFQYPTMDKPLIVEGKKLGSTSSDYLDNFYASLPARYQKSGTNKKETNRIVRPTTSSLAALHRPDSCRSSRRLNGWYGGGGGGVRTGGGQRPGGSSAASTFPPTSSRPMTSLSRAASHTDLPSLSRPPSSLVSRTLSSSNTDLSSVSRSSRPR